MDSNILDLSSDSQPTTDVMARIRIFLQQRRQKEVDFELLKTVEELKLTQALPSTMAELKISTISNASSAKCYSCRIL